MSDKSIKRYNPYEDDISLMRADNERGEFVPYSAHIKAIEAKDVKYRRLKKANKNLTKCVTRNKEKIEAQAKEIERLSGFVNRLNLPIGFCMLDSDHKIMADYFDGDFTKELTK